MTCKPKGKKTRELRHGLSLRLVPGSCVTLTHQVLSTGFLNVFHMPEDVEVEKLRIVDRVCFLLVARIDSWVLFMVPTMGLLWTTIGNVVQFEMAGGIIEIDRFDAA